MNWTSDFINEHGHWPEHWCLRTFVVDDMPQIVSTLTRFLEIQPGFNVVGSAGGAVEALAQCAALKPDLVLIDEELPDLPGHHCARLIRERYPWIQVVLMSGYDDLEWQICPEFSGAFGFVAKTRLRQDLLPEILRITNQSLKPFFLHDQRHLLLHGHRQPDLAVSC